MFYSLQIFNNKKLILIYYFLKVERRYSEFEWLKNKLTIIFPGCIVFLFKFKIFNFILIINKILIRFLHCVKKKIVT